MNNVICECKEAAGCGWHIVCGLPDKTTFNKLSFFKKLKLIIREYFNKSC
jgi:hypothetical protein